MLVRIRGFARLLPLTLVDWFGVWYIPHRTVAFMAIGVALLSGIALSALLDTAMRIGHAARRRVQARDGVPRPVRDEAWPRDGDRAYAMAFGATPGRSLLGLASLFVVAFLALPSGFATHDWYRIYDQDDYRAWDDIDARDPGLVVTGDWRAKAGYRAMTGNDAIVDPGFFWSKDRRELLIERHPDLVVLVDSHARKNQTMEFMSEGWRRIGAWGDNEAFVRG